MKHRTRVSNYPSSFLSYLIYMQLELTNRTAYNGLVTLDFSRTIDNTKYFLRKQLHYQKFDSSVYLVYDEKGRLVYVGKGKFD